MRAGALILCSLLAACGSPPRSRCERVCARENQCAREAKPPEQFEWSECVEECSRLERDPALAPAVERHVACVDRAASCADVLRCE
jgi:hypothetical protein